MSKKIFLLTITCLILINLLTVNTDTVEKKDEIVDYSDKSSVPKGTDKTAFAELWERQMFNYEPDYVYMFPVPYKTKEFFYENIEHIPADIKGAFLTDDTKEDKIDFIIQDPDGNQIYYASKNADIFNLRIEKAGIYSISFNNRYVNEDLKVTFTMNTGHEDILKKEHLEASDEKLNQLKAFVDKLNLEFKMNQNVYSHRKKSKLII